MFSIPDVQKKSLKEIHDAIEAGKKSPSQPLRGHVTVCALEGVMSAGGILTSPDEIGTITLGAPFKAVRVSEEDNRPVACTLGKVHFALNALKVNEFSGNQLLASFKRYIENPEFLLE